MNEQIIRNQNELRRLLEANDKARAALNLLELDRGRLRERIASIEASVAELQESLSTAALQQVQEDYLAAQLQRLDAEISTPNVRYGAPGGIERRASPRPQPIRLPTFDASVAEPAQSRQPGVAVSFLDRARRVLRKETAPRQARTPGV